MDMQENSLDGWTSVTAEAPDTLKYNPAIPIYGIIL
jgi:hypothetical protein